MFICVHMYTLNICPLHMEGRAGNTASVSCYGPAFPRTVRCEGDGHLKQKENSVVFNSLVNLLFC